MVYNRTITRFIADDKVVYQRVRRATRLASALFCTTSFEAFEPGGRGEFSCAHFERGVPVSREISPADWCLLACPPGWARGPPLYAPNAICRCLVAGLLYPSCRFSSADYQCFQVSNPCRQIYSTAFMYHIPFTDRFLIRISSSCVICMLLFNFTDI